MEEKEVKRVFAVDDSILNLKSKIKFQDIIEICAPIFKPEGYRYLDFDLLRINFSDLGILAKEFGNIFRDEAQPMYVFLLEKENHKYFGIYKVFSKKLVIVENEDFSDIGSVSKGILEFVFEYSFADNGQEDIGLVCQESRRYKVLRPWFSLGTILQAIEDKVITREYFIRGLKTNPKKVFEHGMVFSDKVQTSNPIL